jgi:acyl-CoA thioesterase-1
MHALPNLGKQYADAYDAVFARLSKRPGILYDPFFLEGIAADRALNQADGLHPNPEGVRRTVARILPLVVRLVQEAQQQ